MLGENRATDVAVDGLSLDSGGRDLTNGILEDDIRKVASTDGRLVMTSGVRLYHSKIIRERYQGLTHR